MNIESFPCQLVSWEDCNRLAKALARKIKSSGYHPDLVIAIGRGGYVPARLVCDFLLHSLLTSIKVEHWGIAASELEKANVRFPLAVDVNDMSLLVVDDITDTGDTLRIAVGHLRALGAKEIRTGVLQHKIISSFEPDYFGEMIVEWRWIIYPWAAHEDLVGFTEKVLSDEPRSNEQIFLDLKRRYSLIIDKDILSEVLADLINMGKVQKTGNNYQKIF